MTTTQKRNWLQKLLARLVPVPADFFALLAEQSAMVTVTIRNLDLYMRHADVQTANILSDDEHAADTIKIRNLHQLNRAFSTPIDREDIYRAIEALDWMITHCKSTINELLDLDVAPDQHMQNIVQELLQGSEALERGFQALATYPAGAEKEAQTARHSHRRIERLYRHSLADLFQGEVTTEMLRKREIYHHLMDGSRRLHAAANVLHDIMVKLV
ncbi:hypothetical protein SAMN02745127_00404 [Oceanospirillum multiglobuliferum]|uniref:Phosphate transport regulator n=1 Tax=Oceanospirillum multiglobuliferum TaxID=64969 RepID=A0A1T4LC22_9GAMM|nr:DUF47 family protein [Oceanospirillum multiglobuliferum]OPX56718.1 hypothetical protein BTE48_02180 [Oceanospirillum multiglobuliferum]SJZ52206.1 hypothetical protein SAMN02745127_00404 [Oceanospirillum multiglobuliferum]